MKNITLSIPDDLLARSREYAQSQGKSLNKMVRDLLYQIVEEKRIKYLDLLDEHKDMAIDTRTKYRREELYER